MSARATGLPDAPLLCAALALLALGVVMVASASTGVSERLTGDPLFLARRHGVYAALGLLGAWLALRLPLRLWAENGYLLVGVALSLLVLVLVPGLGKTVNGATRWLDLKVIGLQVSEPARLLLLLYLAGYLERRGEEVRRTLPGFLKPLLILGLAAGLILLQPDFGAACVLLLTALGMMFLAGVRWGRFCLFLASMAALFAALVLSSPYRLQRLTAFLDPWSDPFGSGFQLTQSLIAFGSGGVFGVGLGRGVQKLFYLPEAHNDFLFAVLAEELGLIGVGLVLVLFLILAWRALAIGAAALRAGRPFAAYTAWGLGLWLSLQALINMGVNMGLLPTKGITLPLVSAGGSSLVACCVALGLILRADLETRHAVPAGPGATPLPRRLREAR